MNDFVYVPAVVGTAIDYTDAIVNEDVPGTLLEANPNRKSAMIVNVGEFPVRITTDGSDPASNRGKPLLPGGILELKSPYCPTAEVLAISTEIGSAILSVSEVV